jgi:cyanophycinase
MRNLIVCFLLISTLSCSRTELKEGHTAGPEKGFLIIAGGNLKDTSVYHKFMELAGGPNAPIVIITTAAEDDQLESPVYSDNIRRQFEGYGFRQITILHTRNPEIACSDTFIAPLRKASGLWFTGGRQWRLVDAYSNTKSYKEFVNLLNRGGVIGGSSAGATIQGSFLVRGDTKTNTIMMGDHQVGFGFIKNIAIDQHLLALNRQFDIFQILEAHPELLGIGLDENTAIVVKGDEFEVIGRSYVAIYDGTFFAEIRDNADWSKKHYEQRPIPKGSKEFYLLKAGERYNIRSRKVIVNE